MRDIKTHAADIIDWFIEKGVYLPSIRNTPVSSNGTLSDNTSYRDDLIRVRPQHTLWKLGYPQCGNFIMFLSVRCEINFWDSI